MAIDILNGTIWAFKGDGQITSSSAYNFNIRFISNSEPYTNLNILKDAGTTDSEISITIKPKTSTAVLVYGEDNNNNYVWFNNVYRIIRIVGGADALPSGTNFNALVNWLETNATLVPVENLEGTTWTFNNKSTGWTNYYDLSAYSIKFLSNDYEVFNEISCKGSTVSDKALYYNDTQVYKSSTGWSDVNYSNIFISTGTDTTNPDFMIWLTNNATLKDVDVVSNGLWAGEGALQNIYCGFKPVDEIFLGETKIYQSARSKSSIYAVVSGLGSQDPVDVDFTFQGNFTPSGLGIKTVKLKRPNGSNGENVFVKIPTMYRKTIATNGQVTEIVISNTKRDAEFKPYSCFVTEDGNGIMPYILIGKYWNTKETSELDIVSQEEGFKGLTTGHARTVLTSNYGAANYNGYQLFDWQIQSLWRDLFICFKESIDNKNASDGWEYDTMGIYWKIKTTSPFYVDGVISSISNIGSNTYTGTWNICKKPSKYASLTYTSNPIPSDYESVSYGVPTITGSSLSRDNTVKSLGYDSNYPFFNYPSEAVTNQIFNTYYCDQYTFNIQNCEVLSSLNNAYNSTGSNGVFSCEALGDWNVIHAMRLCYRPLSEAVYSTPTYTVTLVNTGNEDYTVYDGQSTSGTFLTTVSYGTPRTVTCENEYLYIRLSVPAESYSISTDDIVLLDSGFVPRVPGTGIDHFYQIYHVRANGTITIDSSFDE